MAFGKKRKQQPENPLAGDGQRKARASKQARQRVLRILLYVIIGILLALPAVFVNTAIGYIPIVAYLFMLLLSYLYIRMLKNSLEFSSNSETSECMRGENVEFKLTVTNKSILPAARIQALFFMSDLFGGEGATSMHNISLGPRDSKTFSFGVRFDHIGSYQVGIRETTVLDPLGLFSSTQVNDRLTTTNVQPRIYNVAKLPIAKDATVEAKKNFTTVINDGMDYSGVREYRWGDPIKTIHWKLSARMPEGEYYTRLYETNANPGLAIIADFDAPAYTPEELMSIYDTVVETAFSLERYANANGFDAEVIFQDKAKRTRRYMTPFTGRHQEILDRMPQIFSPGTGREALSLIRDELGSVFAQSNLIVISSVISDELMETLIAARVGKREPLLFAVIPETIDDKTRAELLKRLARLGSVGISYTIISDATALSQEV